jgi:hypothetical protein
METEQPVKYEMEFADLYSQGISTYLSSWFKVLGFLPPGRKLLQGSAIWSFDFVLPANFNFSSWPFLLKDLLLLSYRWFD